MIYGIFKTVIESKNYELSDILTKIEKRCLENRLTEEERDELSELARANADFKNSIDVIAKLQELEMEIKALKEQMANKTDEPTVELYEEYVAGKWYYNGDTCSEDGKNYTCTAPEGKVCTWSPSEYPPYWMLVE